LPNEPTAMIRVLFVEDQEHEAELATTQLQRAGLRCITQRVDTEPTLRAALQQSIPDVILSDFTLPQFGGLAALEIAQELAPEVPFIFLSGTIGEERAIDALRRGAVDYVLKENIARLAPAVRRALADVAERDKRRQQERLIARLNRVLRVLSGVNGLLLRVRDRNELLKEICRLAVSVGGYAAAVGSSKIPGATSLQPVAWSGAEPPVLQMLRAQIEESASRDSSIVGRVMKTGEVFVCNDTARLDPQVNFHSLLVGAGLGSFVALPLVVDKTSIGLLFLAARDPGVASEEELSMLREVGGNLSFALQYLQKETTVKFLSHFDPQTGLAKRGLFCDRLARLIAAAGRSRTRYAISVLDVEHLSVINDSFGRRTGDLLLQHVADRLKRRHPNTEGLAHFSGGTFAMVRELGVSTVDQMLTESRQQTAALFNEPFKIEQRSIPVAVRSGFAVFPDDGTEANVLVQNAEAALRNARSKGEHQFHYDARRHSQAVSELALEHKLRQALDRNEFELHYQPKVNVVTRRIQGVEALIRWRSPEDGLQPPATFLPLLEATGLAIDVGDWVVRQAARDCCAWRAAGLPPTRVAVNISPLQLQLPDFVQNFIEVQKPWTTPRWGLDIEITEGALLADAEPEIRKLQLLRNTGVRVAIDDFGTGYSSLTRLSSLPIDTLKIDRSFISQVVKSAAGDTLVKTIVGLARAFKMLTVAEGVETQEQLDFLWQVNCDQSQGFLHSRAVTAPEFATMLLQGKGGLVLPAEPET
jgi:diguanylate cyclase (GGDEF)-like protein